jgi:hypothetical protein
LLALTYRWTVVLVCVLTPSGAVAREAKVACEPETLIAFLRDLNLTIACVGLKAGPLS